MQMSILPPDMKLWRVVWKFKDNRKDTLVYSNKKRMINELYNRILYQRQSIANGNPYYVDFPFSVEEFDIVKKRDICKKELEKEFQIEGI